jgi:hypothetical protein
LPEELEDAAPATGFADLSGPAPTLQLMADSWSSTYDTCRFEAEGFASGPLALERLSWREDGRLSYRLKRSAPDGSTHLALTPLELPAPNAAVSGA